MLNQIKIQTKKILNFIYIHEIIEPNQIEKELWISGAMHERTEPKRIEKKMIKEQMHAWENLFWLTELLSAWAWAPTLFATDFSSGFAMVAGY
jgi:hypothetical protein